MSNRSEILTEEFKLWLDRYTPRRALLANERAMAAEIKALMKVILSMAPASDFLTWLEKVTNQLDFQMKTAAWPTVSELGSACSNQNKQKALQNPAPRGSSLDPVAINSKRMNEGENVGDGWVYGRGAVSIMQAGDVSSETMRRYRSALYFAAKSVHGEEKAQKMEADWIARHDAAESLEQGMAAEMPVGEPFKRIPKDYNDQSASDVEIYGGAA